VHLKDAIEKLIKQGRLKEYMQTTKKDYRKRRRSLSPPEHKKRIPQRPDSTFTTRNLSLPRYEVDQQ